MVSSVDNLSKTQLLCLCRLVVFVYLHPVTVERLSFLPEHNAESFIYTGVVTSEYQRGITYFNDIFLVNSHVYIINNYFINLYPSSFKLLLCWLRSLTPVT
ncbi:hypothetical protein PAU_01620 [Photorhabdus asymbiotica]|uniref:Uncharacterized protein n=1 Tax=Photorhabdus asymbiotica subsp. asymbiotica (strain ATCC 43949 / 3105-77) TaxID=553480 RepID=C7BSL8_PHOAA|nr:hypothetical protein PAU_01620 [Photorhabdus asymbiotica]